MSAEKTVPIIPRPLPLKELNRDAVLWVQQQLVFGNYLAEADVDGIVGPRTTGAFNAWKEDAYQAHPGIIGQGSIDLLALLDEKNPVSEQQTGFIQATNANAGRRSGKSATLPAVGLIYADQWIDENYPYFTWGELTKNLTRLPDDGKTVRNGLQLIRAVGKVREKHGVAWRVTSGYRPPAINRAIGGARNSTHIYFRGIDVTPANLDFKTMLEIARDTPEIQGIGLGQRRGFLHFDIGWGRSDRRREFRY